MLTPAQQHLRKQALEEAVNQDNNSPLQLLVDALNSQKLALKNIKASENKRKQKAEYLQEWSDFITTFLNAEQSNDTVIIGQLLIWLIDVGEYEQALAVAKQMALFNLPIPAHFSRDFPNAFVEEMADAHLNNKGINLAVLREVHELTLQYSWDLIDEIKAKLMRSLGELSADAGQTQEALNFLEEALKLNPKIGVKSLIAQLRKKLNTAAHGAIDEE